MIVLVVCAGLAAIAAFLIYAIVAAPEDDSPVRGRSGFGPP